jgi:hypothetical protein
MYTDVPSSYPKEFFYNLAKLSGSMSKQMIKVTADNVNASPSTITNIRLPIGSLINLESLLLYFTIDIKGTNVTFPARYSSSFVKRMSLTMNNVSVQIIQDYNLVYNTFADLNNKHYTKGLAGEYLDNSTLFADATASSTEVAITAKNMDAALTNQTGIKMCINNWLGLFGSASTKIVNTDLTGEVVVSIEWAPNYEALGGTPESTATTYTSSDTYDVKDIYMTMEALSFSDNSYYSSIMNKDLMIGYDDYIVTRFAQVQKATGINVTTYINAGSLDAIYGTAVVPQSVPSEMICYGSNGDGASGNVINMFKYLSDPVAYVNNNGTGGKSGDGFYSTASFQRQLQHLKSTQFSINNKQLNYGAFNPEENFNQLLLSMGYLNTDSSSNGFHSGIVSLKHFYKYYGVCAQSLELIDKDQFYISGLSSQGSSCSINWKAEFEGSGNTMSITPVIISKLSKVLHIKQGRQIFVE